MQKLFAKPTALALIIGSIIIRLIPHPGNFTPLGATAIFGGAKLARPWNYIAPLFILFLTDLFLGFHALMPYVYGCFLLSVFLSETFLKKSVSYAKLSTLAVANSLIFFLVTNWAVWRQGLMYPISLSGLMDSYVMGLPFLRNMLAGDLVFTLGFFALYNFAQNQAAWRKFDKQLALRLFESGKQY